jgi:hypothetical protein
LREIKFKAWDGKRICGVKNIEFAEDGVIVTKPGILSMVTPEGIPVVDAFCRILSDGGFGNYEALKQSLLNTASAGAAFKGGSKKLSRKQTRKEELGDEDDEGAGKSQMTLV